MTDTHLASDDSASKAELLSRARHRIDLGHECQASGEYERAAFHWAKADEYQKLAERRA